jgi:hypothetical protein
MRQYNPNPKHEHPWAGGRRGTPLDLSLHEAFLLLNPANARQIAELLGTDVKRLSRMTD